ncbi:hypothetical protein HZS_4562 [Henneguya salminicola]|nr:hypothetical protein HZS_4562 [Henneguya salminicola]
MKLQGNKVNGELKRFEDRRICIVQVSFTTASTLLFVAFLGFARPLHQSDGKSLCGIRRLYYECLTKAKKGTWNSIKTRIAQRNRASSYDEKGEEIKLGLTNISVEQK